MAKKQPKFKCTSEAQKKIEGFRSRYSNKDGSGSDEEISENKKSPRD